jgi:hypothetical protein
MTARVEVEEIETTRSEKLLAAVLTAFLLTGLLWAYFHVDVERDHGFREPAPSAADRAALDRADDAASRLRRAARAESRLRRTLVDRREAYRTALEEGRSAPQLARRYRTAQAAYEVAQEEHRAARRLHTAAQPAARAAEGRLRRAEDRELARVEAADRRDGRISFARRLALVLVLLGAGYALLGRLRRRRSRWLPTAIAAVAAVALLAVVMAIDYLTDYVEVTDLGVLVLAAAGALMTIVAFAALQRYLARRLPERRVRRRECPFCGYPTGDGPHCSGCGRDVVAECTTCHAERRVGTRHCGACGAA